MPGAKMGQAFNLDEHIRKVPDFPKKGILFYDITSILINPGAFNYCIDSMLDLYRDKKIDAVAAIEARGFLFAAPYAARAKIPLVLIRKKGKLPGKTLAKTYSLEYGEAEIEIHPEDVSRGSRVLLLDDLIATGGTLKAARELITACGAEVPGIFGVVGLPFLNYEKVLAPTPVHTLLNYQGE
jgi:adenine phosphoribosyltransferase